MTDGVQYGRDGSVCIIRLDDDKANAVSSDFLPGVNEAPGQGVEAAHAEAARRGELARSAFAPSERNLPMRVAAAVTAGVDRHGDPLAPALS